MTARQKFQKALMLLDRGSLVRGEEVLREVIDDARTENDQIALIQGLVCLGDLLLDGGSSSEARSLLQQARRETRSDDLLADEFARAKELLDRPV